jgi:hypothetical protein
MVSGEESPSPETEKGLISWVTKAAGFRIDLYAWRGNQVQCTVRSKDLKSFASKVCVDAEELATRLVEERKERNQLEMRGFRRRDCQERGTGETAETRDERLETMTMTNERREKTSEYFNLGSFSSYYSSFICRGTMVIVLL